MTATAGDRTTIRCAEVDGVRIDVRLDADLIVAVGRDLPGAPGREVDANGGALLPGLHDHHLHLLAMAAAARSVDVAPAAGPREFDAAIVDAHRGLPVGRWMRVVGYDEPHGPIDRHRLDRLAPNRAIRVQHRSGAAWVLSSAGLAAAGAEAADGWVHRADARLRGRWADPEPLDLAAVGRRLAALGVTGVTDATPFTDTGGYTLLAAARTRGDLPQRVVVTGGPGLATIAPPVPLEWGPVKVVVEDHNLPSPDELIAAFRAARRAGRAVAVHCVTRVALVLALVAWEELGAVAGDRVEHASVVPVELMATIAGLGLHVVTQPTFVRSRGDRYLEEVDVDDLPHLLRCGSLLDAGIGVGGSTDAPFGPDDPWLAIRVAAERTTAGGRPIGRSERIDPARALAAFLSPPDAPGGAARTVRRGALADLCLLDRPLAAALEDHPIGHVRATWIGGRLVHGAPTGDPVA